MTALYDYTAMDSSSLTFRRHDVIGVVNKLDTGWWDGFLGDVRGWFPSNYVTTISEEEAEELLFGEQTSLSMHASPSSRREIVTRNPSDSDDDWLHSDIDRSTSSSTSTLAEMVGATPEINDYWCPEMMADGQIVYVNTHTGEKSRDLPKGEGDLSASIDMSILSSSVSSSSNISALADLSPTQVNHAGFGVPRPADLPEAWVKRLGDDKVTYFYVNERTGETRWTLPESEDEPQLLMRSGTISTTSSTPPPLPSKDGHRSRRKTDAVPERTPSAASHVRPLPRVAAARSHSRVSIHSDDSEMYSMERERADSVSSIDSAISENIPAPPYQLRSSPEQLDRVPELTSAERIAQVLQTALAPPRADAIADLLSISQAALAAVLASLPIGEKCILPDEATMDQLIHTVVVSIRNLLYVAAISSPHISDSVLPRAAGERRNTTASQNQLKPPQRRVTATLAKLVLSARTIKYDSGPTASNAATRIKADAEELVAAVVAFVGEVERCAQMDAGTRPRSKRIQGVFSTTNIGLGLVGAGAAGSWKGFGWMALDENDDVPRRVLGIETIDELNRLASETQEIFVAFQTAVSEHSDAQVIDVSRKLLGQMSTFLSYVTNIHVARHVDIDGIGRENISKEHGDVYEKTINDARLSIRALEAAMQSLYDDGATFLARSQAFCGDHATRDTMDTLVACMELNLDVICQSYGALLALGHSQAELSHRDHRQSIDWRMSRITVTPANANYASSIHTTDSESPEIPVFINGWSFEHVARRSPAPLIIPTDSQSVALDTHDDLDDDGISAESPIATNAPPKAEKLKKFFGNDAPRHYIEKANADQKPWYLRPSYSPSEILIDPDGTVRGGTVPALVERLTAHEHGDPTYIKSFMMTFKSFTTVDELFNLLVQRFWVQPPSGLKAKELEDWTKLKQHIIQMRVLNTFKSMVTDEVVLEKEDLYILDRIREFVTQEEVYQFAAAKVLLTLIERKQNPAAENKPKMTTITSTVPPPIQPKAGKKLKLLDIDPLEMARQLTIMESNLYQAIKPIECLQRSRENKGDHKDNITNVTQNFNRLANWIQECILAKDDRRERANVIKYFITVAEKCRTMNNFSSMVAIISGLNAVPVRRLKRSWEQVSSKLWGQMNAYCSGPYFRLVFPTLVPFYIHLTA
ncbi:hypothetical protein HWV62_4796 [Athelia sp. TMB]|nr:hypothetical protein HWV62_4796 [Athelia sp. TMB]